MSDKVDFCALVIGMPGFGKSSLAAHLAEDRLKAGRVVLVQDAARDFRSICAEYPDVATYKRALKAAGGPKAPTFPRGAAFALGADPVLELAKELGEIWNKPTGGTPVPICVVINEASSSEESGSTYVGRLAEQCLNQRRHLGLELIYCLQRPTQLTAAFWDAATRVDVFYQRRRKNISAIEDALDRDRGSLSFLGELPRHRHWHWTPPHLAAAA